MSSPSFRATLPFVLALAAPPSLLAAASSALVGCRKGAEAESQAATARTEAAPIHVTTAAVVEKPMPDYLVVTGSLSANRSSDIAADASGKVIATYVERGQAVKQGELVAVLDKRAAALTASAAEAQENLARAQADLAKRDCERGEQLYSSGSISKAEYDRIQSQCSTSKWSVAAAEAQQASAAKTVGDANIKAPFTGTIGERFVNVGQYVQPSTKVASIYSVDPLRLELTIPEANIGLVRPDLPVAFHVAAYGDETFTGKVRYISPNVRASSRDLVVEAVVPNADGKLRPGMFATVNLQVGEKKVPVVPKDAVVPQTTGGRLFVVANGRIEERIVETGEERDGVVPVTTGVKAGENVVLKPSPDVRDGVRVQ